MNFFPAEKPIMAGFRRTVDRTVRNGRTNTYFTKSILGSTTRIIDNINTEIYIRNVPYTYTEDDLCSIFEEYGIIMSCYIKPVKHGQKFTWALIEYDNRMDAEVAVRDLDGRPPYNFFVTFYNSNEEEELRMTQYGYSEPSYNHSIHQFRRRALGHPADFVDEEIFEDYENLEDKKLEHYMPHENYNPQPHKFRNRSNSPDTRFRNRSNSPGTSMLDLKLVVNNEGAHQISEPKGTLGKYQPLRKTRKDVLQAVETVISFKILGIDDTFGKNGADDDGKLMTKPTGRCQMCGIMSSLICTGCQLVFYCGSKCQENNWPKHKSLCLSTVCGLNHIADDKQLEPCNLMLKKENDCEHSRGIKFNQSNYGTGYTGRKDEFENINSLNDEKEHFNKNRHEERNSNSESRNKGFQDRNKFNESRAGFRDYGNKDSGYDRFKGCESDQNKGLAQDRNKGFGHDRNKFYENKNSNFVDRNRNFEDRNKGFGNGRGREFGNTNFRDSRSNGNHKTDRTDFALRESSLNKNSTVDNVKETEDSEFWDENVNKSTPDCNLNSFGEAVPSVIETPKSPPLTATTKLVEEKVSRPVTSHDPLPTGVTKEVNKSTPDCNLNSFGEAVPSIIETPKSPPLTATTKLVKEKVSRPVTSHDPLPIGVTKEVVITNVIEKGHYRVHVIDMIGSHEEMSLLLNELCKTAGPLNLVEKAKCIVYSKNFWFRGIIKTVSPLDVYLVDYGGTFRYKPDQIRAIPEELVKFPVMAVRIKLAPNVREEFYNYKEDDRFYVKAMTKDICGAIIVEVISSEATSQKAVPSVSTTTGSSIESSSTKQKISLDFLPKNVFSKVLVTLIHNEKEFSINRVDSVKILVDIGTSVLEEFPTAATMTPILNDMCLGEYIGEWYRGKITSVNPLRVLFIDYGNEETCTVNQIRAISPKLSAWPPQALKLRLSEGSTKAFSDKEENIILEVKPVSEDNGVITVVLKGSENNSPPVPKIVPPVAQPNQEPEQTQPQPTQLEEISQTAQPCSLSYLEKNVTDLLKEGYTGILRISKCTSEKQFIVTVSCNQLEELNDYVLIHLLQALEKQPYDQSFRPKVNEVVGVELKEDGEVFWGRAVHYLEGKFVSCDTGLEVTPLKIKKIPSSYSSLPHIAAFCELQNFKVPVQDIENKYFKEGNDILFEVSKVGDGFIQGNVISENTFIEICDCILDPWQPYLFIQKNLLKSGSRVFLSSFKSLDEFYVLFEELGTFGFLSQFKKDIETVSELKSDPKVGTLVACQFSVDKEWYRAEILEKTGNGFQVYFVDYGNTEEATLADFKSLPRRYKHIPYEAIKVGLANNVNKPLTTSALDLLHTVLASGEPLKIIFENDLTSVTLLRADGENFNDQLNIKIDTDWNNLKQISTLDEKIESQEIKEKEATFLINSLPQYCLEFGTELDLMVMSIEDPWTIIVTETSNLAINEVDELTVRLMEYYNNSLHYDPYNPSENELCAAIYQGSWYRAVCLDPGKTESKVKFIDFGNQSTVEHTNIRRLTTDFLKTPARGHDCTYEAIPKNCSNTLIKRLNELLIDSKIYKIVVKKCVDNCYTIDIPSVTLTLQKEGFL